MLHSTRTISSVALELEAARQEGRTIVRLMDERDAEVETRLRALEQRRHRDSLRWLLGLPALVVATGALTLGIRSKPIAACAPEMQPIGRTAAR